MIQPNPDQQAKADQDLEEAEAWLWENILTAEQAWPEHYREAAHQLGRVLAKFLDPEQVDEVLDAVVEAISAAETVALRVGFDLGRTWTAYGELEQLDICRAVEKAGGNPGRVLAEVVEHELAKVVQ
jgi:hypothetical protein